MTTPNDAPWTTHYPTAANLDLVTMGQGTSFPSTWPLNRLFLRTDQGIIYKNTNTVGSPTWTAQVYLIVGTPATNDRIKFDGTKFVPAASQFILIKAADESVTSSTTFQNDDHMFFSGKANKLYQFELWIIVTSPSLTPDLKITWSLPSGATWIWSTYVADSAPSSAAITGIPVANGVDRVFHYRGVIIMGGTAGTCNFQWAQNVSDGNAVTLKKGTHMTVSEAT